MENQKQLIIQGEKDTIILGINEQITFIVSNNGEPTVGAIIPVSLLEELVDSYLNGLKS